MPGSVSDRDLEFLQAMNPNLAQTPEGRRQLIETRKKLARREQEVAKMAREYAAKNNGRLDSGFEAVLADYAERNPLFEQQAGSSDRRERLLFPTKSGRALAERLAAPQLVRLQAAIAAAGPGAEAALRSFLQAMINAEDRPKVSSIMSASPAEPNDGGKGRGT